jgi:hypothetical protein
MIGRFASIALLLAACSSSGEKKPAGKHEQPDHVAVTDGAAANGGSDMDLFHSDRVVLDLDLAPDAPVTHRLDAPPNQKIVVAITHTGGAVGRIGLTIHDIRNDTIPVSDDGMTCSEPGCHFSVEVATAPMARTLFLKVAGSVAMTVRLEATVEATGSN